MTVSVKTISATSVEAAIADLFAGLTQQECKATLTELRYGEAAALAFSSAEEVTFTVKVRLSKPGVEIPF